MALCLVQQLVPEDLHGAGAVTDEAGLHTQNQALDLAQLVLILLLKASHSNIYSLGAL